MDDLEAALRQALRDDRASFEVSAGLPRRIKRRTRQRAVRRRAAVATIAVVGIAVGVPLAASTRSGPGPSQRPEASARWSARLVSTVGTAPSEALPVTPGSSTSPNRQRSRRAAREGSPSTAPRAGREGRAGGSDSDGSNARRPSTRGSTPRASTGGAGPRTASTTSTTEPDPGEGTPEPGAVAPAEPPADVGTPSANEGGNLAAGGGVNADASASRCIDGPDTLAVGQSGVYTTSGDVDPFTWTPPTPGTFDVALELGHAETCHKIVTVAPPPADPGATDPGATDLGAGPLSVTTDAPEGAGA